MVPVLEPIEGDSISILVGSRNGDNGNSTDMDRAGEEVLNWEQWAV